MFNCKRCDKKIKSNEAKVYKNTKRFCDAKCRINFFREQITKKCMQCDKIFLRPKNSISEFCSYKCNAKHRISTEKNEKFEKLLAEIIPPCAVCGKDRYKMGKRFIFLCDDCEYLESYESKDWLI